MKPLYRVAFSFCSKNIGFLELIDGEMMKVWKTLEIMRIVGKIPESISR
jgi:hypothetical protein